MLMKSLQRSLLFQMLFAFLVSCMRNTLLHCSLDLQNNFGYIHRTFQLVSSYQCTKGTITLSSSPFLQHLADRNIVLGATEAAQSNRCADQSAALRRDKGMKLFFLYRCSSADGSRQLHPPHYCPPNHVVLFCIGSLSPGMNSPGVNRSCRYREKQSGNRKLLCLFHAQMVGYKLGSLYT